MDDNFEFAKDNILKDLEDARQYTGELYEDELAWKIDKVLADAQTKVRNAIRNYTRKWIPPHNEDGRCYLR